VKLFSYIVDHDTGYAPNPSGGFCTLVCCKFSKHPKWKNIVELADRGDWIVGLGGRSKKSSGHGTIVYAMRITDKISLEEYCKSARFRNRDDASSSPKQKWRQALISKDFYYFGCNAKSLPADFFTELKVKRGFRNHFPDKFITKFVAWVRKHRRGKNGEPCWQAGASGACGSKHLKINKPKPCPKSI
jgi:Nucleotide modification associated domain 2